MGIWVTWQEADQQKWSPAAHAKHSVHRTFGHILPWQFFPTGILVLAMRKISRNSYATSLYHLICRNFYHVLTRQFYQLEIWVTCLNMIGTSLRSESWKLRNRTWNASQSHFYCFPKDIWILESGYSLKSPIHALRKISRSSDTTLPDHRTHTNGNFYHILHRNVLGFFFCFFFFRVVLGSAVHISACTYNIKPQLFTSTWHTTHFTHHPRTKAVIRCFDWCGSHWSMTNIFMNSDAPRITLTRPKCWLWSEPKACTHRAKFIPCTDAASIMRSSHVWELRSFFKATL